MLAVLDFGFDGTYMILVVPYYNYSIMVPANPFLVVKAPILVYCT